MSPNASAPNSVLSGCLTLKQHSAFLLQRSQQLVERMREGGGAISQQFFCDFPQVYTQLGQASQHLFGIWLSRFECWLHPAVITECIQRRGWNGTGLTFLAAPGGFTAASGAPPSSSIRDTASSSKCC